MTALAMTTTYQGIGDILHKNFYFPPAPKSISTIKKVISVATDKKSADSAKEMVKLLKFLKANFPTESEGFDLKEAQIALSSTNENILSINKFFETINNMFDGDEEVVIDDTKMLSLMANMKEAKEILESISQYLCLACETYVSLESHKNGTAKVYTYDELIAELEVATL